ncbi:unnamed protein product [Trichogramma brassicae]|uniref:Tick transposon n=1 Tax=Trichogramma brassicae TaxID=86971 RepID=A0A6H5IA16_9HYME|nr:unnamed protein product [Trichogramma brassicae]
MFKLRHLPKKVLVTIYYAYVYSIINYGLIIWSDAYKSELKQLEKLHGRFHQVVKDNNIPTIRELYVVNCIMFHYEHLSYSYKSSCSKTRTKCLPLPSHEKTFYVKNSLKNMNCHEQYKKLNKTKYFQRIEALRSTCTRWHSASHQGDRIFRY